MVWVVPDGVGGPWWCGWSLMVWVVPDGVVCISGLRVGHLFR